MRRRVLQRADHSLPMPFCRATQRWFSTATVESATATRPEQHLAARARQKTWRSAARAQRLTRRQWSGKNQFDQTHVDALQCQLLRRAAKALALELKHESQWQRDGPCAAMRSFGFGTVVACTDTRFAVQSSTARFRHKQQSIVCEPQSAALCVV